MSIFNPQTNRTFNRSALLTISWVKHPQDASSNDVVGIRHLLKENPATEQKAVTTNRRKCRK